MANADACRRQDILLLIVYSSSPNKCSRIVSGRLRSAFSWAMVNDAFSVDARDRQKMSLGS